MDALESTIGFRSTPIVLSVTRWSIIVFPEYAFPSALLPTGPSPFPAVPLE